MKRVTAFGSAAASLLLLTALAASAGATSFCERNESSCSAAYTAGVPLTLPLQLKEGTTSTFKTSGLEIKCTSSSMEASFTEEGESEVTGQMSGTTFGSCSNSCTMTVQNQPYHVRATATEGGDGTWTLSSGGSGSPRLLAKCSLFGECTYGAKEPALKFDGAQPPTVTANSVSFSKESGSFLCSSTATWSAEYAVPHFESLFLEKAGLPTVLCGSEPEEKVIAGEAVLVCEAKKRYGGKISGALQAGTTALFESNQGIGNITCSESTIAGQFNKNGLAPLEEGGLTTWSFNSGKGLCTSQLGKQPGVQVEISGLPYEKTRFAYLRTVAAQGQVTPEGGATPPRLRLDYEGITCLYATKAIVASNFYNAIEAKKEPSIWQVLIAFTNTFGAGCQPEVTLRENLTFSKEMGGNLFLAR